MRKLFRVSIFGKNYDITSFYHAKLIPGYYFMKNNPEFYRVSLTRSRVIKKMSLTHHFIFYHTFIRKYLLSLSISTSSQYCGDGNYVQDLLSNETAVAIDATSSPSVLYPW